MRTEAVVVAVEQVHVRVPGFKSSWIVRVPGFQVALRHSSASCNDDWSRRGRTARPFRGMHPVVPGNLWDVQWSYNANQAFYLDAWSLALALKRASLNV